MKYITAIVIAIILLGAVAAYFYYQNQQNSDSMIKSDDAMMQKAGDAVTKTDSMVEKSGSDSGVNMEGVVMDGEMTKDSMMTTKGTYTPFSESKFNSAKDKKRVLFFFANWCPTCKPIDAELSANAAKIPEGIEIFRVNYNDTDTDAADKELAAKYGITYQHTFVQVDASGGEIAKWNGGGLDKIVSMVK
jgi:thiol-disulfide isomerase/thioredoxin